MTLKALKALGVGATVWELRRVWGDDKSHALDDLRISRIGRKVWRRSGTGEDQINPDYVYPTMEDALRERHRLDFLYNGQRRIIRAVEMCGCDDYDKLKAVHELLFGEEE